MSGRAVTLLVLALVVSACGSPLAASPGADASASAASSQRATATPVPNWAAMEPLDDLVEQLPTDAGWPLQWAVVAHGSLWIPNFEGDPPHVTRLDPETLETQARIELDGDPEAAPPPDATGIAASPDGIWVTLATQDAVGLIDPATNEVVRRIEVATKPYGIAVDGTDLWVVDLDRSVRRIDTETGEEIARIAVDAPYDIVVADGVVWVTEFDLGNVVRIDPATNEVVARIQVGGRPGLAVGLGSVWARSNDRRVVRRIDLATNEVIATVALPSNPQDLVIAGGAVWVATQPQRGDCETGSDVVRVNPATNAVDGLVQLPCAFSLATDGDVIWASTYVEGADQQTIAVIRP